MQQLVLLLASGGQPVTDLQQQAPWIETRLNTGGLSLDQLIVPLADDKLAQQLPRNRRVFKTHAPVQLMPCTSLGNSKVIVVARNVKDACVSAYYHNRSIPGHKYDGPWHNFVELFAEGKLEHGSWWEHTAGWFNASRELPEQILFVTYESLKDKPNQTVKKIAQFLSLDDSDTNVSAALEGASFSTMKSQSAELTLKRANAGEKVMQRKQVDGEEISHFRKGKKGGWKGHFTVNQSEVYDKLCQERMVGKCVGFEMEYGDGTKFRTE